MRPVNLTLPTAKEAFSCAACALAALCTLGSTLAEGKRVPSWLGRRKQGSPVAAATAANTAVACPPIRQPIWYSTPWRRPESLLQTLPSDQDFAVRWRAQACNSSASYLVRRNGMAVSFDSRFPGSMLVQCWVVSQPAWWVGRWMNTYDNAERMSGRRSRAVPRLGSARRIEGLNSSVENSRMCHGKRGGEPCRAESLGQGERRRCCLLCCKVRDERGGQWDG